MERQIMKRSSCDSGKDGIRHFEVIYLKLLAPIEINGLHILRYREAMHRHVLACFVLPPIDHTRILRRVGFHGLKIDECVIHKIYVIGITVHPVGVERDIEALRHIYKICRLQNMAALFYGVEPRYKLAALHPTREKLAHENHGIEAEERFLIREQVFFGTDRRVLVFVKAVDESIVAFSPLICSESRKKRTCSTVYGTRYSRHALFCEKRYSVRITTFRSDTSSGSVTGKSLIHVLPLSYEMPVTCERNAKQTFDIAHLADRHFV